MPSVDLTRLNAQIEALFKAKIKPDAFIRNLNALLQLYSHQAYSAGLGVIASAPSSAYRVPEAVMAALEKGLIAWAGEYPKNTLFVADALWIMPQVENKHLALLLLSIQPEESLKKVLWRVNRWLLEDNESNVQRELVVLACAGFLRGDAGTFLAQVERWLRHKNKNFQKAGLVGLAALSQHLHMRDNPQLLDILQNRLEQAGLEQQALLYEILQNLIPRHPAEITSIFLDVLVQDRSFVMRKLARRCLPLFPARFAEPIRQALKT